MFVVLLAFNGGLQDFKWPQVSLTWASSTVSSLSSSTSGRQEVRKDHGSCAHLRWKMRGRAVGSAWGGAGRRTLLLPRGVVTQQRQHHVPNDFQLRTVIMRRSASGPCLHADISAPCPVATCARHTPVRSCQRLYLTSIPIFVRSCRLLYLTSILRKTYVQVPGPAKPTLAENICESPQQFYSLFPH